MRKKVISLLLIIFVLLILVGCENDKKNNPPVIESNAKPEYNVEIEETVEFYVRFKDPDGDNVSVAVTSEPVYLARFYNESTGIFSWVANEPGNHWIKFSGFDGEATANRTVYINVDNGEDDSNGNGLDDNGSGDNDAEVNHPPVLISNINDSYVVSEDDIVVFQVYFKDPEDDPIEVEVISSRDDLSNAYNKEKGLFRWKATLFERKNNIEEHEINIIATDGKEYTSKAVNITVERKNLPPRLEKIGNKIKSPGETLSFKVSAHDPDGIDKNIRYEVDDLHEYFNEETGVFHWENISEDDKGVYSVTFRAIDELGASSDPETIIIKINSIPEFTGFLLNGVVVDETEPIIFTAGRDNYLEIKAHDSDNDRIEIEINNIEGHLDADKHFVFNENNNTGILSWAPTSDRIGEELSITFKVTDYPGELYDVNYTSSNLVSIVIRVE